MALTLTAFETVWNTTTTPKTVSVTGGVTGDYIFMLAVGDMSLNNAVTAVTTTTTAGSTTAWTEPLELINQPSTSEDWISTAWAQITADGSVTVSVARTKNGTTGGMWGFYALLAKGSSGIGNTASVGPSAAQVVSLVVSQANSGVAFIMGDWDAGSAGTAWVPATAAVLVERTVVADMTTYAAYWPSEAAGTRNYGSSGGAGGSHYRCAALEIKDAGGAAPAAAYVPRRRGPNYRR